MSTDYMEDLHLYIENQRDQEIAAGKRLIDKPEWVMSHATSLDEIADRLEVRSRWYRGLVADDFVLEQPVLDGYVHIVKKEIIDE